jgi:1,2-phenylacetyl-CoA epoxidase catalytic subunit
VEGEGGNREVPPPGILGGAEASLEEEGGSRGKPGFPRGSERKVSDERAQLLIGIADDEMILGWRDSEWTGIAPFLEEDVAFSSIAQNEIGHARALYELAAQELGTTADELAFDRKPEEYRCCELVELRLPEWERTIARHVLYEEADAERLERLKSSDDAELAGLAAKIDREEAYHRIHAQMWADRLRDEPRFQEALAELRPLVDRREGHTRELSELWEQMTEVRRSQPAGTRW